MPPRRANALGVGSAETPGAGSEVVNESPDRAGRPRRPPRKARRRVIAGGYGEEEQRRAAGCIGRPATGGDSFTASKPPRRPTPAAGAGPRRRRQRPIRRALRHAAEHEATKAHRLLALGVPANDVRHAREAE